MYLRVLYGSQNKQRLLSPTKLNNCDFLTETECVYCAVRVQSLNKAHCVSSLRAAPPTQSYWRTQNWGVAARWMELPYLCRLISAPCPDRLQHFLFCSIPPGSGDTCSTRVLLLPARLFSRFSEIVRVEPRTWTQNIYFSSILPFLSFNQWGLYHTISPRQFNVLRETLRISD